MIKDAISKVSSGKNLSQKESEDCFAEIMQGAIDTDTIADFLLALKKKGETIDEITGAARIMRKFAVRINTKKTHLLDTCGTGGDNKNSFNISTLSAIVAAGAGIAVAKHGNRAVSSRCGSADLLEKLGVNINVPNTVVENCINELGLGFLFAPRLHLAMKYAMPARQKIKVRTIFNILGPLTNPAGARYSLVGVYDEALVPILAGVLKNLGSVQALIVHGKDGLDEATTTRETSVAELKDGKITTYEIRPEDFGIKRSNEVDIAGGDAEQNKNIATSVLKGKRGPARDIVILNAGAAIYAAGGARGIRGGIKKASESIDRGMALNKLEKLKEMTNKALA